MYQYHRLLPSFLQLSIINNSKTNYYVSH
jgi:hypothetical protein